MTIEIGVLRGGVDAVAYISLDVPLKRQGHEYHGPCPFCGRGVDRFVVWPENWRWWCRRCEAKGNLIEYVRRRNGIDFLPACEVLARFGGVALAQNATRARRSAHSGPTAQAGYSAPDRTRTPVPSPEWRAAAIEVVERCERALWSSEGADARAYLHEQRGLKDKTIRKYRLGLSNERQRIAEMDVPAGITIPWLARGELWQVKVRTHNNRSKYLNLKWADTDASGATKW